MINARISIHATRNPEIREEPRREGESNAAWIARVLGDSTAPRILLVGGAALTDFRVRVAQSHVRSDLKPSFWSHAAVLVPGAPPRLFHVDFEAAMPASEVPGVNGISEIDLDRFDDLGRFPNLALLRFPGADAATVLEGIGVLRLSRLSEDLVSPLVRWLGYVWGVDAAASPLVAGVPLPSAQFVDAAFAYANVDIVPGLSSRAACPEAIWQASLWWTGYYAGDDADDPRSVPCGSYVLGQRSASVRE
ncbi:MAG: hypothetical protein R3A79_09195 [Nannocystaceae bacterium]